MKKFSLLIGGCPRSGTTALLQLFNSCDQVYISSEEDILEFITVLKGQLATKEKRAKSLERGMRSLSERETLSIDKIHDYNFTKNNFWTTLRYVYKIHHQQLHDGKQLILWGDKLPSYYNCTDKIVGVTKFKYLHITRNPLDVINSMIRRTEMAAQGKDWWKAITDFDEMLSTWRNAYCSIKKIQNANNVLHIYYEDLIFEYEKTILKINNFLEVDYIYDQEVLIKNKASHFKREYLSEIQTELILNDEIVKEYLLKIEL